MVIYNHLAKISASPSDPNDYRNILSSVSINHIYLATNDSEELHLNLCKLHSSRNSAVCTVTSEEVKYCPKAWIALCYAL